MSGPERHVEAARRQQMRLQVLLINHKLGSGGEGTHIHLQCTYERIINVQGSGLTWSKQSLQSVPYKGTEPEAPVRTH